MARGLYVIIFTVPCLKMATKQACSSLHILKPSMKEFNLTATI